ncbi:unnamed protein product [Darwinula stevensoni]|uniref:Uncharacterized protein n=1 Tax=Darwinula stevensoni TaxID=69355 RepID=A0A7R8X7E5_9CRUS|nr:unnamed protein product [Darwinula stevensoni]CAG0886808.1 unnamed protein product [Darwinula stevensoni]
MRSSPPGSGCPSSTETSTSLPVLAVDGSMVKNGREELLVAAWTGLLGIRREILIRNSSTVSPEMKDALKTDGEDVRDYLPWNPADEKWESLGTACKICQDFSSLEVKSYERRGNLDIRQHLRIYMGADEERPLKQAAEEYVQQHYPEASSRAYSLPEGYILTNQKFRALHQAARKLDVDLPPDQLAVAKVFDKVKEALQDVPSLTVCDYAFTDTLLKGINQQQKNKFIKNFGVSKDGLLPGDHDVFGIGNFGEEIIGLFFQVKGASSSTNPKGIRASLQKATEQIQKDLNVFSTLCGEFLNPNVKLAGFAAFPMLSKSELEKTIRCENCRMRILASEDLSTGENFKKFLKGYSIVLEKSSNPDRSSSLVKTFKDIFDLYVSAASFVDFPRNPTQLYTTNDEQMHKMLVILTPKQRELVKSRDEVLFICGGCGTGKTFVLKKRAEEMAANDEVVVINIVGGLLTEEFRCHLKGMKNIKVFDWREEGLGEDLEALKKFLMETGQGKHVQVDEVPITLGFRGIITSEALSKHWEWFVGSTPPLKSITLSFRPNDQSYERDFPIQDVNPGGREVRVLEGVKRNTRKVAELFLAIGDYARRIFPSLERTLPLDLKESGEGFKRGFLSVLFSIPSCFSIHPGECKDVRTCETVRAMHAIRIVHEERSKRSTPIFVVVDNVERKNAIVKVTASIFPSLPLIFLFYSRSHHAWEFHGHGASEGSSPIVVATESEMTGCHPNNLTIVVDHSGSQWQNYSRLIATTGENKILVVEEEQVRTGKFSHVTKQIPGWTIKERGVDEDLKLRLNEARSKCDAQRIVNLEEEDFPLATFPGMETDWNKREGEEKRDVEIMLRSSICGIFGPPAPGKSLRVSLFIARATERGERVVFLHPGYVLFLEHRRQRVGKDEVDLYKSFDSNKIKSFQDVVDLVQEALKEKEGKGKNKKTKKKQREEKSRKTSPPNIVVEDCPLLEELNDPTGRLK